jgi:predicted nucleotidyltransferase
MDPYAIDMEKVRAYLEEKDERRHKNLDTRFEHALRDFERIVARIVERYHPPRVYQWGSLLERRRFSEISDIDIAVEGLGGPEEYFAILGDAIEMTDLPVDIIELDKVPPAIAHHIRKKGRLVYDRTGQS